VRIAYKNPNDKLFFWRITNGNKLRMLQILVDGDIEVLTMPNIGIAAVFNGEGQLREFPYNCDFGGFHIYGPLILCGIDDKDFTDMMLSKEELEERFPELFEVRNSIGGHDGR